MKRCCLRIFFERYILTILSNIFKIGAPAPTLLGSSQPLHYCLCDWCTPLELSPLLKSLVLRFGSEETIQKQLICNKKVCPFILIFQASCSQKPGFTLGENSLMREQRCVLFQTLPFTEGRLFILVLEMHLEDAANGAFFMVQSQSNHLFVCPSLSLGGGADVGMRRHPNIMRIRIHLFKTPKCVAAWFRVV